MDGKSLEFDFGEKVLNRVRRKLDFDLDEQSLLLGFNLHVYACLFSCLGGGGGEGIVVLIIVIAL